MATDQLKVGRVFEQTIEVTPALAADVRGNPGVPVFATPALVELLEYTAVLCVQSALPDGAATVGTHVDVHHIAATPIGMTVTARAELIAIDGKRLTFAVSARDQSEPIAHGRHERHLLSSLQKFLSRVNDKLHPTKV